MNENYLTKLHGEILTIMDEIHRICQEQGLSYYLTGGTLLGAIRHGGFIPWDDDLDIVMPRKDFEIFVGNFSKWTSPNFTLEWITTNPQYVYTFAKVTLKNTLFVDSPYTHNGIFVDVFPLDSVRAYSFPLQIRKFFIKELTAVLWHKLKKDCFPRYWFMWLPSILFSFRKLHALIELIAKSYGGKNLYYANFGSQYSIKKQTMPIEWWGKGQLAKFEGRQYVIPIQYNKILASIFGTHYMILPPENKRRSHYPQKVIFSDGMTMDFVYNRKVSFAEQENDTAK